MGIANKELKRQNKNNEERAAELIVANKKLSFHAVEKKNHADELALHNDEKEKRGVKNKELEVYNDSLKLDSHYSLSLIEASLDPLFAINLEGKLRMLMSQQLKLLMFQKRN